MKTVALLIFEGVELMDFAGPAEVFIVADEGRAFRVVTVAESTAPLRTMGGISLIPDCSFADAPPADVVVVPGGNTRAVGEPGRAWLRRASAGAEIVLSVCYGALLLAEIGLLAGLDATTHHLGLTDLARAEPTSRVIAGRRFVSSGKIVTAAGVTAGIDGALHVVERMLGEAAAAWVAETWMEHRRVAGDWRAAVE